MVIHFIVLIVLFVFLGVVLANSDFLNNTIMAICLSLLMIVFTNETLAVGLLIVKAIKFKLWKKKQQKK